jgi:hypothetical protein
MKKQIAKIYKRREKAHEELLKCDVELDEILKGELKRIEAIDFYGWNKETQRLIKDKIYERPTKRS